MQSLPSRMPSVFLFEPLVVGCRAVHPSSVALDNTRILDDVQVAQKRAVSPRSRPCPNLEKACRVVSPDPRVTLSTARAAEGRRRKSPRIGLDTHFPGPWTFMACRNLLQVLRDSICTEGREHESSTCLVTLGQKSWQALHYLVRQPSWPMAY